MAGKSKPVKLVQRVLDRARTRWSRSATAALTLHKADETGNARLPLDQPVNGAVMRARAANGDREGDHADPRVERPRGGTARAAVVRIITSVSVPRPPFVSAC